MQLGLGVYAAIGIIISSQPSLSLAEQFRHIKRSLAEQFRQIKRSLAKPQYVVEARAKMSLAIMSKFWHLDVPIDITSH